MALPLSVLADNPRPALVRAKKVKPVTTNGGVLGDHRKLLEELANVEARQKVLSKLLNPYLNKVPTLSPQAASISPATGLTHTMYVFASTLAGSL
mmetsp:Transcript_57989/g.160251  ORF Transcript_57989/g.160251 Transcript_57989/m.160251 type:complete len:95 (+) Transcript_57989:181-465(+)